MAGATNQQPIVGTTPPAPSNPEIDRVASLRRTLWNNGYRPLGVYSPKHDTAAQGKRGKRPIGLYWEKRARLDPPEAVAVAPDPRVLNTGLLCDGFRNVDVDIDDRPLAEQIYLLAVKMLGQTIVRCRGNSPRLLLTYRAAYGQPGKVDIAGKTHNPDGGPACKIEVLGHGQQYVAFGKHESGADIAWWPKSPAEVPHD